MKNNSVLLLGNGINNIESLYTWGNLVNDLISFVGAKGVIDPKDKPFPMLYEEVFVEAIKKGIHEDSLKEFIAEKTRAFKSNTVHERIASLEFSDILTTNYDYAIETSFGIDPRSLRNAGAVSESLYNVFRHSNVGKTRVWHIHGEARNAQSITLGFEHYAGYLQQLRNFVVSGTGASYKKEFAPLMKRLRNKKNKGESWAELFFTRDICMLGLTLDFVEMDLWWLLTYRARQKFMAKETHYKIKNKVWYYYPEKDEDKIKHRLDLLRSADVLTFSVPVKGDDWKGYYGNALNRILTRA